MSLTALEKFKLLKAGKPILEDEDTLKSATQSAPQKPKKAIERIERFSLKESPLDPDSSNEATGEPHPKKLGEPCNHPKDRISSAYSPLVGTVKVCLDCGRQINDKDLVS
jgi:hypothetical protein